jgi:hypothetical protein
MRTEPQKMRAGEQYDPMGSRAGCRAEACAKSLPDRLPAASTLKRRFRQWNDLPRTSRFWSLLHYDWQAASGLDTGRK